MRDTGHDTAAFGTAVNCMDGRVQLPVIEWLTRQHGVDYVDVVTEPGPVAILADAPSGTRARSIRARVAISVEKHGSRVVVVVGHHDCAGNPVGEAEQRRQLRAAVDTVASWGFAAAVAGLWLGPGWHVERAVARRGPGR